MPKIKTRKSISKRVRATGTGKLRHCKMFSGCKHIRSNKTNKQVRGYRKADIVDKSDEQRIKPLVPYI